MARSFCSSRFLPSDCKALVRTIMALSKSPDRIKLRAVSCSVFGSTGWALAAKTKSAATSTESIFFIPSQSNNNIQRDIVKKILLYCSYSQSFPFTAFFFQASVSCSNSCISVSEKFLFVSFFKSGDPAFTHAVYQNDAVAKMD